MYLDKLLSSLFHTDLMSFTYTWIYTQVLTEVSVLLCTMNLNGTNLIGLVSPLLILFAASYLYCFTIECFTSLLMKKKDHPIHHLLVIFFNEEWMERKGSQNSLNRKMNAYHDGKYIHTSVFGFVPFPEFEKTQVVTRKASLSVLLYQYFSINTSLSILLYQYFSISTSLSVLLYQYFSIGGWGNGETVGGRKGEVMIRGWEPVTCYLWAVIVLENLVSGRECCAMLVMTDPESWLDNLSPGYIPWKVVESVNLFVTWVNHLISFFLWISLESSYLHDLWSLPTG